MCTLYMMYVYGIMVHIFEHTGTWTGIYIYRYTKEFIAQPHTQCRCERSNICRDPRLENVTECICERHMGRFYTCVYCTSVYFSRYVLTGSNVLVLVNKRLNTIVPILERSFSHIMSMILKVEWQLIYIWINTI